MPYTTRARLERFFRTQRLAEFLDRDGDGIDDAAGGVSVFDDVIERAANELNARLAKAYRVPFAAQPATPPLVADLTDKLAGAMLVEVEYPDSAHARRWRDQIDERIDALVDGDEDIPGGDRIDAGEGRVFFAYYASTPKASGDEGDGGPSRGFL